MKKINFIIIIIGVLLLCFAASVFADTAIKIYYDHKELETDVDPILVDDRVLVPIRVISEELGMDVTWKNNAVYIESEKGQSEMRIRLLEQAIAPKDALSAAKTFSTGVKMRNGAQQFAVMSPELRDKKYSYFADLNWVTGTSSPWIESYTLKEIKKADNDIVRYEAEFIYTDSTGSKFSDKKYIIVENFDGTWLVTSFDRLDVKGSITKIDVSGDKLKSFFVEDSSANKARYDKATVLIGDETKIFMGYTETQLDARVLKEGINVEVTFTDDPMIMIYPPQATAKTIRVLDEIETQDVEVYYICTKEAPGGLYPVSRKVPGYFDPLQAAIEEMLKGPTEKEISDGFKSHFSESTSNLLNGIEYSADGKTVTIDFTDFRSLLNDATKNPKSFAPGGIMADITWTIFKQFPEIEGLRFSFDGDENEFWSWLNSESTKAQVFTRTDWEQV